MNVLVAGLAAAALIPSIAAAQQTCAEQRSGRVAGTLAGAGIGALAGSAVAGHGDKGTGAVIGAIAGGIIGNQVTKPKTDCIDAYGYYDHNGVWHANAVPSRNAVGYYDANGVWVEGPPNGYYDADGRWIAGTTSISSSGYYDADGRWVPVAASGYYDANGRWVAGSAPGYYDYNGRWIPGAVYGYYDQSGRWVSGSAPGRYVNGRWVADAAYGYWDRGRWIPGRTSGYYDANGRWIVTTPSAGGYGRDVTYEGRDIWAGAPLDIRQREAWLERRIRRGMDDGSLNRFEANRALRDLFQIRREESRLRLPNGALRPRDRDYIQAKLDNLSRNIRWMRNNDDRRYDDRGYDDRRY
jgi:hypothetical protein